MGMWSSGTFLVGRGTSSVTSSVGRQGSVVCMLVAGLVTHLPVIHLAQQNKVQKLLVDRYVVLLGEIAGIHVLHFVTLMLLVLIADVIFLSQSLVLVAG